MKISAKMVSLTVLGILLFIGCAKATNERVPSTNESFTYAYTAEITTLDPNHRVTPGDIQAAQNCFDTLSITMDGQTHYRLAKNIVISADQTQYHIMLRDDVTFHDGTKMTAKDVVYSIEDNRTSEVQSMYTDGIERVEVINDYELILHSSEPNGLILYNLNHLYIIPAETREKIGREAFAKHPIGSGPYKFVSYDITGKIEFEAYENYYLGLAAIKKVTGFCITDDYTRAIALENGEIDFGRVSETGYESIKNNQKLQTILNPMYVISFVVMNTQKLPFDNLKLRQAIAYGVNREMMYQVQFAQTGEVNSIFCAKSVYGYSPDVTTYDYNPEKARQLLAEGGIKTPYDIGTIDVQDRLKGVAEVLQNNLSEIGLIAKVNVVEFASWFKMGATGELNMGVFSGSWGSDLGHFFELFNSATIGAMNFARYANPQLDAYMNMGIHNTIDSVRKENYRNALEILQTEVPYIHLYDFKYAYGASADLNLTMYTDGIFFWYELSWK
jgi:peptide/nickel transport system substrate-binding protein